MPPEALIIIPLTLIIVFPIIYRQVRKARAAIETWAASRQYSVLHKELRILRLGPFWFRRSSKYQLVFYVVMLNKQHLKRKGYVRVGSLWGQMRPDTVVVYWDD